jgi:hypothetical protein
VIGLYLLLLLILLLFGMLVNRLYTQTKTNSKQRYTMQQLKKRLCTRYGKRSIKPPEMQVINLLNCPRLFTKISHSLQLLLNNVQAV